MSSLSCESGTTKLADGDSIKEKGILAKLADGDSIIEKGILAKLADGDSVIEKGILVGLAGFFLVLLLLL